MGTPENKSEQSSAKKGSFEKVGECLYRYAPNGTYYARVQKEGKEFRRSLRTTDRAVAKRKLADFQREVGHTLPGAKAVANVHDDIYTAVTELPRPKDIAFLTNYFPTNPWLDIPPCTRQEIIEAIAKNVPPADLVYRRHEVGLESTVLWKPTFPEIGLAIEYSRGVTTALIQVHWDRGVEELKEAFERFLSEHRPPNPIYRPRHARR